MLSAGDVLADRFEVQCLSASGGMGSVFRARDRASGNLVAVKVLRTSAWDDVDGQSTEVEVPTAAQATRVQGGAVFVVPSARGAMRGEQRERFLREARVLAQLAHPTIARYIARGFLANGAPYLVMEWLEGETQRQRHRCGGSGYGARHGRDPDRDPRRRRAACAVRGQSVRTRSPTEWPPIWRSRAGVRRERRSWRCRLASSSPRTTRTPR